jgi:fido (protein-threonine AMPylation protein)
MLDDVPDWVRIYTQSEEKLLATHLKEIVTDCHAGKLELSLNSFLDVHRRLFVDVRDHAGKNRAKGYGDERLVFGPNRSEHRDVVLDQLEKLFADLQRSVNSFATYPDAADFEENAFHVAVWAHAEIIRIHPFLDGNGRTSRILMNTVLVKLGFRPVPIEVVKQEYNLALNYYFSTKRIQPLLDIILSVASQNL